MHGMLVQNDVIANWQAEDTRTGSRRMTVAMDVGPEPKTGDEMAKSMKHTKVYDSVNEEQWIGVHSWRQVPEVSCLRRLTRPWAA